jgi:hypothetical protein
LKINHGADKGSKILSGRMSLMRMLLRKFVFVEHLALKRVESYVVLGDSGVKVAVLLRLLFNALF